MVASCSTLLAIHSGLSYWSDYFNPDERLRRPGYSTGRIAEPRCGIMAEVGEGGYWDNLERLRRHHGRRVRRTLLGVCRSWSRE
jgi:hypothetical protein